MQSRVFHTKFWRDPYVMTLSVEEKFFFVYLITNPYINILHIMEVPDAIISEETKLSIEKINLIKQKLAEDEKITVYKNYILLNNAYKYQCYRGIKSNYQKLRIIYELSDGAIISFGNYIKNVIYDIEEECKETNVKDEKFLNLLKRVKYRVFNLLGNKKDTFTEEGIDGGICGGMDGGMDGGGDGSKKSEIRNQKSEKEIGRELLREREKDKEEENKFGETSKNLNLADDRRLNSSIGAILQERIQKIKTNGEKKSGISTPWQDKAFRYAEGLKIQLTEEYKARWFRVFKLAYEGRNSKNVDLAYSYLSDYPRELSNEAKIKLFFWIYEHGLPKQKLGFAGIKVLMILALFSLLFSFLFFLFYKIDKFFDRFSFEFKPPVVVKIQKPIKIIERKEKIVYIKEFVDSLPKPKTPIEKYICEKFGSDCQIALAVAKAESGMREEVININSNGSLDMGIFQINSVHWGKPGCNPKALLDAHKNTDCAYQIWKRQGWSPWVAYQNGRWLTVNSK